MVKGPRFLHRNSVKTLAGFASEGGGQAGPAWLESYLVFQVVEIEACGFKVES